MSIGYFNLFENKISWNLDYENSSQCSQKWQKISKITKNSKIHVDDFFSKNTEWEKIGLQQSNWTPILCFSHIMNKRFTPAIYSSAIFTKSCEGEYPTPSGNEVLQIGCIFKNICKVLRAGYQF